MRAAMRQMNLSAKVYHHILKLARTIADLAGNKEIQSAHLAKALQCRPQIMRQTNSKHHLNNYLFLGKRIKHDSQIFLLDNTARPPRGCIPASSAPQPAPVSTTDCFAESASPDRTHTKIPERTGKYRIRLQHQTRPARRAECTCSDPKLTTP